MHCVVSVSGDVTPENARPPPHLLRNRGLTTTWSLVTPFALEFGKFSLGIDALAFTDLSMLTVSYAFEAHSTEPDSDGQRARVLQTCRTIRPFDVANAPLVIFAS